MYTMQETRGTKLRLAANALVAHTASALKRLETLRSCARTLIAKFSGLPVVSKSAKFVFRGGSTSNNSKFRMIRAERWLPFSFSIWLDPPQWRTVGALIAVALIAFPSKAALLPTGGGEKVFMNCISPDRSSPGWMLPNCKLSTDEALTNDLTFLDGSGDCNFNYWDCAWISPPPPMGCGLNQIIGQWAGCTRTYSYRAWDCSRDCKRDAHSLTESLNHPGVAWVDYSHLMCRPGELFYRDIFNSGLANNQGCLSFVDRYHYYPQCPAHGNPIYSMIAVKRQEESLGLLVGGITLSLVYDSGRHLPATGQTGVPTVTLQEPFMSGFGSDWTGSFHKRVTLQVYMSYPGNLKPIYGALLQRGAGQWQSFQKLPNGSYSPNFNYEATFEALGNQYLLTDKHGSTEEVYDSAGTLISVWLAAGGKLTYTYSTNAVAGVSPIAGLLIGVADQFGRSLQFNYEQSTDGNIRIYKVVAPDGQEIQLGHDSANNLSTLTWPDTKVKGFVYERSDIPWALTGIVDEDNKRYAAFGYDGQGRATSTEHAGGTNRYSAQWTTPPQWQITETFDSTSNVVWRDHNWALPQGTQVQDPLGNWTTLGSVVVNGVPREASRSRPGGSGCGVNSSEQSYDGRGNLLSRLDFGEAGEDRKRTCYAYDANRNVQTVRVEGLRESDVCAADLSAYQVDPNKAQRKVSTKWHPLWKLEARRAEPKLITTTVYNGQPDPIAGDSPDCAPGAPLLPDNLSKIAVVCRRYEQSTSDEMGNLGFTAPVTETRQWSYTYNQYGQVLTETDPRNKTTSYEYWGPADTSFTGEGNDARGHWFGDLKTVSNALGHKTEYLEYNKRGQPTKIRLPNGSLEQREYHVRGWLTKVTQTLADATRPQLTQYDYYATGLLQKATQPDGSWAEYSYDAAHRLTDVADSVGNSVHYVLDNAGNRTAEEFKDPAGALAKTITRTFDALGRMSSTTGLTSPQ